ncbi:MAG: ATP-binding protein [Desulfomonilia bacterium]
MANKPCCTQYEMRIKEPETGEEARRILPQNECWNGKRCQKGEQHFRDLVENSPTGICIVQDGRVVYRNPEQQRIFGPLEEGPHPSIFDRIHPDDREELALMIESTLSGRAPHMGITVRFTHVSGDTVGEMAMKWLHCRTNLIENEGRPAVLINMMDVTRTVEIERLLKLKDRMISLGHVAAGIAHEIRNPLSGINIYLDAAREVLEEGEDRQGLKDILEKIQAASSTIESVIRRVMDFSKPSEPKLVRMNINKPIEDALGLSSAMLRKSGIEISTELADDLPSCMADHQLIEQVVLNLITNAAEAMKDMKAGKRIVIRSSHHGDWIRVSISDSGPGISHDLARKIFEPFFTTKENSTGIGLSLCQRIIMDHKGSMGVATSVMGGADFAFTLPVST